MIDIHSHLIYGVDDGSNNIDTSIDILSSLADVGITDIILTPHYIAETKYTSSKMNNIKKYNELKDELKKKEIDINIYLGNEIYIDENILDNIKNNEICSLNNTEYILVELPMSGIYDDYQDLFHSLMDIGFKIVLAHPERYVSFQNDYNKIDEMVNMGVLLQCNIDSILGAYGRSAKKTVKYILKNKYISFIGTDIHSKKNNYNYIEKAKNKFKRYLSDDEINNIFNINAKNIIKSNDKKIKKENVYKNDKSLVDIFNR